MQFTSESRNYECADCGFAFGLSDGAEAVERFIGTTGRPIHRVVTIDGVEMHRCTSLFMTMSPPTDPLVPSTFA